MTIQGSTQLTVGDDLELTCTADTHADDITYSWTIIHGQTKTDLPERQTLEKESIQKSDEGNYTCEAENGWGYGTATVTVEIQSLSTIPGSSASSSTPQPGVTSTPLSKFIVIIVIVLLAANVFEKQGKLGYSCTSNNCWLRNHCGSRLDLLNYYVSANKLIRGMAM